MGIHPAGTAISGQRERVDHRPGARLQVEVVNPRSTVSQCAAVAAAYRLPPTGLPVTAFTLSPVRARTTAATSPWAPPVGPDRFVRDLQPATEIAGFHPSGLIPRHPQRPQEPKPPQQIHPV